MEKLKGDLLPAPVVGDTGGAGGDRAQDGKDHGTFRLAELWKLKRLLPGLEIKI